MLGVVLINYKNHKESINYINNELSKVRVPKIIVIVDNSCDKNEYLTLRNEFKDSKQVYVIDAEGNLGYARGNNLGAKYLIEKHSVEYFLFSNTDIQIKDEDVVGYMINKIKDEEDIVSCNPRICSSNGLVQTPYCYISFFKMFVLKRLLYPFLHKKIDQGLWSDVIKDANEGVYYRLSGAFLLVKAKEFQEVGMFDPNTFLFAEEAILAEKFKKSNMKCAYYPDRKVIHEIHGVIGKFVKSKESAKYMLESNLYYQSKYKKRGLFQKELGFLAWYVFYNIYRPIFKLIGK